MKPSGEAQNKLRPDLQSLCDRLYEVFNENDTPDELSHGAAAAIEVLWRERDAQRATIKELAEMLEKAVRADWVGTGYAARAFLQEAHAALAKAKDVMDTSKPDTERRFTS